MGGMPVNQAPQPQQQAQTPAQPQFDPRAILQQQGIQLPAYNPFLYFPAYHMDRQTMQPVMNPQGQPELTVFGRHPQLTGLLEGAIAGLQGMGQTGMTPNENIKAAVMGAGAYPQMMREHYLQHELQPLQIAGPVLAGQERQAATQAQLAQAGLARTQAQLAAAPKVLSSEYGMATYNPMTGEITKFLPYSGLLGAGSLIGGPGVMPVPSGQSPGTAPPQVSSSGNPATLGKPTGALPGQQQNPESSNYVSITPSRLDPVVRQMDLTPQEWATWEATKAAAATQPPDKQAATVTGFVNKMISERDTNERFMQQLQQSKELRDASLALEKEGIVGRNEFYKLLTAIRGSDLGMRAMSEVQKAFEPATTADYYLGLMRKILPAALQGNQQAQLALLSYHIGMTIGGVKGSRVGEAQYKEAEASSPLLQRLQARLGDPQFDKQGNFVGFKSGVVLTPDQMNQMVDLANEVELNKWKQAAQQTAPIVQYMKQMAPVIGQPEVGNIDFAPTPQPGTPAASAMPKPTKAATSAGTPPISLLKEGHITTFANGQSWELRNGKPIRVNTGQ